MRVRVRILSGKVAKKGKESCALGSKAGLVVTSFERNFESACRQNNFEGSVAIPRQDFPSCGQENVVQSFRLYQGVRIQNLQRRPRLIFYRAYSGEFF